LIDIPYSLTHILGNAKSHSQRFPIPELRIGDAVAYTQEFLDRNSRYPNDLPAAQGKVKALHRLDNGTVLADIDWSIPGVPKRVNVKSLMRRHSIPPCE
jgi:hypothetical protein